MSIQVIAIASALILSGGSALAAEKVGRTIEAEETVTDMCRKLLANPVTEDFEIESAVPA